MKYDCIPALVSLGISHEDATALRRISMTLHRWHELECGDGNDHASWCVVRGKKTGSVFEYDEDGAPYLERHFHRGDAKAHYSRIGDRERGSLKRLAAIMARYPTLLHYVQGDPRGAALYILRPGDVPAPVYKNVDAYYSRGIVVCK